MLGLSVVGGSVRVVDLAGAIIALAGREALPAVPTLTDAMRIRPAVQTLLEAPVGATLVGALEALMAIELSEREAREVVCAWEKVKRNAEAATMSCLSAWHDERRARVEAEVAAGDSDHWATRSGPGSIGAELAPSLAVANPTATSLVTLAVFAEAHLPAAVDAVGDGQLSRGHLQALVTVCREVTADVYRPLEEKAVRLARRRTAAQLEGDLRVLAAHLDPDHAEAARRRGVADRGVWLGRSRTPGCRDVIARLPTEHAQAVLIALNLIVQAAKAAGDERTVGQLRADAVTGCITGVLAQMWEKAAAAGMPVPTAEDLAMLAEVLVVTTDHGDDDASDERTSDDGTGPGDEGGSAETPDPRHTCDDGPPDAGADDGTRSDLDRTDDNDYDYDNDNDNDNDSTSPDDNDNDNDDDDSTSPDDNDDDDDSTSPDDNDDDDDDHGHGRPGTGPGKGPDAGPGGLGPRPGGDPEGASTGAMPPRSGWSDVAAGTLPPGRQPDTPPRLAVDPAAPANNARDDDHQRVAPRLAGANAALAGANAALAGWNPPPPVPIPTGLTNAIRAPLVISHSTVTGADHWSAHLPGYGPLPASAARDIAVHACFRWLHADSRGYLLHRDPRRHPPPSCGWESSHAPAPPGLPEHITAAMRQAGYVPGSLLRAHVEVRDAVCIGPVCHHAARTTPMDLDHTVNWGRTDADGHLGETTACNLGMGCRRVHQLKTHGGWKLVQTGPGTFEWTSPLGVTVTRYATPLLPGWRYLKK